MIRLTLLSLFISFLAIYAWKDWYKSLCGLIVLMAVIEHPDMPKTIFGIQGLNPWNIGFVCVLLAWAATRGREKLNWDMTKWMRVLFLLYLAVIVVAFVRMMADRTELEGLTTGYLISEYLINCIKWPLVGIMLFDGCRDRSRFMWGVASVLLLYLILAIQVIRWMPLAAGMSGMDLTERSLKILKNEIGYHRVNLSMMLGGASWAIFAARPLANGNLQRFLILAVFFAVIFGQALTGGRAGYVTWVAIGFTMCFVKWRKYLLLIPVVALLIAFILPSAIERFMQGFYPETRDVNVRFSQDIDTGDKTIDKYKILAGRNVAWPYVVEKIGDSWLIGYGGLAMRRTGIYKYLWERYEEIFAHPHNAYLEILLDNGITGFLPILFFYGLTVRYAFSLFRDSRSPVYEAAGGVALALVLALLFASMGSQTFYPREGSVGMWCAIGLMLRIYIERARVLACTAPGGSIRDTGARSWVDPAPA